MYFLTHKITRKLHLHWFLYNIVKKSLPIFRRISRLVKPSTRMYKTGWGDITKNPDYYEKVIKTKLAVRPTRLRPAGSLPTPVQAPVPGEAWMGQSLGD
jgi:hypothetical protein